MKSRFLAYALTALFGMATLTSCGDDDGLSAEQQAYITENKAYIWEKKAEKDENGNPVYPKSVIRISLCRKAARNPLFYPK